MGLEIPLWMMIAAAVALWVRLARIWARERSYENGYDAGYADALEHVRHSHEVYDQEEVK